MGAFVIGREASFTYATGPETYVTTKFNQVAFRISRKAWPTTPPGYLMERVTPGILSVQGYLGNWFDGSDATPPVPGGVGAPSGTVGTLTFTATTGKAYAFKAMVNQLEWNQSQSEGGPPQTYQLSFMSNAQSASDTITVTG